MTPSSDRRRLSAAHGNDSDPVRLLVADDDAGYRAYIVLLARRIGFAAGTASDGEAALEELARMPYDVALIDLQMPRVDGLNFITRMRADEAAKGVYAIMLTAREDVDTKLTALDAGFDDFVTKSFSEAELIAKLAAARRVAVRQRTLDSTIRELYGMATRDELTTVFNRRFFIAEAERMLSMGRNLGLVLFDLDGFKQINDAYGHLAGDQVLRDVGAAFHRNTRPEDLVARYGGDEFVTLAAAITLQDLDRVAARLIDAVRALRWVAGDQSFGINVTAGVASTRQIAGATLEQLLDAADRDLYRNKWLRKHPDARPESYVDPAAERRVDLVLPIAAATTEIEAPKPSTRTWRDAAEPRPHGT